MRFGKQVIILSGKLRFEHLFSNIMILTSTRQNVPSDILTLLVKSRKSGENDVIYVSEITLYL